MISEPSGYEFRSAPLPADDLRRQSLRWEPLLLLRAMTCGCSTGFAWLVPRAASRWPCYAGRNGPQPPMFALSHMLPLTGCLCMLGLGVILHQHRLLAVWPAIARLSCAHVCPFALLVPFGGSAGHPASRLAKSFRPHCGSRHGPGSAARHQLLAKRPQLAHSA